MNKEKKMSSIKKKQSSTKTENLNNSKSSINSKKHVQDGAFKLPFFKKKSKPKSEPKFKKVSNAQVKASWSEFNKTAEEAELEKTKASLNYKPGKNYIKATEFYNERLRQHNVTPPVTPPVSPPILSNIPNPFLSKKNNNKNNIFSWDDFKTQTLIPQNQLNAQFKKKSNVVKPKKKTTLDIRADEVFNRPIHNGPFDNSNNFFDSSSFGNQNTGLKKNSISRKSKQSSNNNNLFILKYPMPKNIPTIPINTHKISPQKINSNLSWADWNSFNAHVPTTTSNKSKISLQKTSTKTQNPFNISNNAYSALLKKKKTNRPKSQNPFDLF